MTSVPDQLQQLTDGLQQVNSKLTTLQTNIAAFLASPPIARYVVPNTGPVDGGTEVIIIGTGFLGGISQIQFGGSPAPSFTVNSYTQITAISPAVASPGVYPISVYDQDGFTWHNQFGSVAIYTYV